jgi:phosphoglycolate phosphatase-like HAD superfamily hydrolase
MSKPPTALPAFVAVDWNGTVVPIFGQTAYLDAVSTLTAWRQAGCLLVVVSCAGQEIIEADVARVGLVADSICGVFDKEPILLELRMRHGAGLYIGDHPADARAAEEAGLPFYQACMNGQPSISGREAGFNEWREAPLLLGF